MEQCLCDYAHVYVQPTYR